MNKRNLFSLFLLLFVSIQLTGQDAVKPLNGNWNKGPADRFKGNVWVEYFTNDTISDFLSSRVLFEPGARSNWHKHIGRQIIFAVEGEGYYKEQGKPIRVLRKGDVVIIEPGTIHSHGAIATSFMQAVMMNHVREQNATTWLSPVSESELSN